MVPGPPDENRNLIVIMMRTSSSTVAIIYIEQSGSRPGDLEGMGHEGVGVSEPQPSARNPIDWLVQSFQEVLSIGQQEGDSGGRGGKGISGFEHSMQAANWWGANSEESKQHASVHPDLVEGAFQEVERDEEEYEASMPYEYNDGGGGGDGWAQDDGSGDDLQEEEEDEVSSSLKDRDGNPIPWPSDAWTRAKKRSLQHLHHLDAEEQLAFHPRLSTHEHLLFRRARETPGWFPGGRFLQHVKGPSLVEDMQDRESYAARKSRALARTTDSQKRAEKLTEKANRDKMNRIQSDFANRAEAANAHCKKAQDEKEMEASFGGLIFALNREGLLEKNRHLILVQLVDYRLGKGRRAKDIDKKCDEREKALASMLEDSDFFLQPTVSYKNVGRKYGIVPKSAAKM